ncbi:MAG: type II toxin-antitoxin system VapC family toxin [Thermomicrobiales bacterium]
MIASRENTSSTRIFVDTAAYFAAFNGNDSRHRQAVATFGRLLEARSKLFTTNFVVAETHASLVRKVGRATARRVVFDLHRGDTTIVRASELDERYALDILERYDDKDFSLTDTLSFAVMVRLGIDVAFTFDRHFAQFGLRLIGPE